MKEGQNMNTALFPVQSSLLDPKVLLTALNDRYDIKIKTCRLWSNSVNDVYTLCTEIGTLYLRISQAKRYSRIDFEEELHIIITLHKNGVSACTPIAARNNEYIWEINAPEGTRYAVLFNEAKYTFSGERQIQLYNLGVMLATLHTVADEQQFKVSREPLLFYQLAAHPLEMLKEPLINRQEDYVFLQTSSETLWKFIKERLKEETPYYGYCHGDMHSGNVIFDGERPQIFDFDCMGYGYRAYDICIFIWNEIFGKEGYIAPDEWVKYIEGYSSIRKLSEHELSCIPAFAALRQLWLMGLHLDATSTNNNWSDFNNDYFNFQISKFKMWFDRVLF